MADIYLSSYHKLVAALAKPPRCPMTDQPTDEQIKLVLAEFGIWPTSILPDVIEE